MLLWKTFIEPEQIISFCDSSARQVIGMINAFVIAPGLASGADTLELCYFARAKVFVYACAVVADVHLADPEQTAHWRQEGPSDLAHWFWTTYWPKTLTFLDRGQLEHSAADRAKAWIKTLDKKSIEYEQEVDDRLEAFYSLAETQGSIGDAHFTLASQTYHEQPWFTTFLRRFPPVGH